MKTTLSFLILILSLLVPGLSRGENPWGKRELLVYTPVWKNPSKVPTFIQEKAEKVITATVGKNGWSLKQVGYLPLVMRSSLHRAEENYQFLLKITDRSGKELCSAKGNCDACTTSEAMEALSALRDTLLDKIEALFIAGHESWKKEEKQKQLEAIKKKLADQKAREAKLKKDLAKLREPVVKYKPGTAKNMAIPPYSHPAPPKKLWVYALGGIALTSLVAGIYLLSVDSSLTCDSGYNEQCREQYATASAGYAFTLTGLAVGGLAGYLFYTVYMNDGEPKVAVTPTVSGNAKGLMLSIRF